MRILIFGDSITQGFYDVKGGWVQRLAAEYHLESLKNMLTKSGNDTTEVFNLGVSGDTAGEVLARLQPETEARMWQQDPAVIVLAVGLNDARQENNRAVIDVYEFQQVYEKLVDTAARTADKILCVGLSAVDESRTNPWPFSVQPQWGNTRINLFEDTIKQITEFRDIPFVPIHDQFLDQLEAGHDLLADGLHPNEAGHQLITELVRPALEKI